MRASGRVRGWMPELFAVLAVAEIGGRLGFAHSAAWSPSGVTIQQQTSMFIAGSPVRLTVPSVTVLLVLCLLMTMSLRLRPVAAVLVITAATVVSLTVFQVLVVGGLCAQVVAGYRAGRSVGWLAGVCAVPFAVLAMAGVAGVELRIVVVLLAALTPAAAVLGIALRRSSMAAAASSEAAAGTVFEYVARGERARIARELHDVVAHHISMVAVQAETARLTTPGMPELGARRLLEIGDMARAGLTEMRRLLGVLREDAEDAEPAVRRRPQPGLAQVNELIDEARNAAGSGVRFIVSGPVVTLDPGVELAAYRIVQEALTNARRHAPGAAVDVELRFGGAALRLRIRDDGPGSGSSGLPGHGLLGMRERAQAAGGELRAGAAAGGGFLVDVTFPMSAAPVPAGIPVEVPA
jgi:signal transduction histidine kinase